MATLFGTLGNDLINGTAESDQIDGLAGDDVINGLNGNDILIGGDGNDALFGGDGNDFLNGVSGGDRMEGGLGDDTYAVENASDIIVEQSGAGNDLVVSSISYTLGNHLENLTLNGSANVNGFGNELNNVITGNAGNNELRAGAGNDWVLGAQGDDVIDGEEGDDTLQGGQGNDLIFGFDGDDIIRGAMGNDQLYGEADDDLLFGGQGDDILRGAGETGNGQKDQLTGAAGRDTFVLGNSDRVLYNDDNPFTRGRGDYALIRDFTDGEDVIELKGSEDYELQDVNIDGFIGVGIFLDNNIPFGRDELIGIVQGSTLSQLNLREGSSITTIV